MQKTTKEILASISVEKKAAMTFSIDLGLQNRFKRICKERKLKTSAVIGKLMEAFLNDVDSEKK